jgi:hypothetical protein
MSLKFNPYIALATAVVGAVAVDQLAKKAAPSMSLDAEKQKYAKAGLGIAALAASYFYGDRTTKAVLLGLGLGGLATQVPMVQDKLLAPVEQKLLKA